MVNEKSVHFYICKIGGGAGGRWSWSVGPACGPHLLVALVTCDACYVPLLSFYIDFGMHVCLYMNVCVRVCGVCMHIYVCAPFSVMKPTPN